MWRFDWKGSPRTGHGHFQRGGGAPPLDFAELPAVRRARPGGGDQTFVQKAAVAAPQRKNGVGTENEPKGGPGQRARGPGKRHLPSKGGGAMHNSPALQAFPQQFTNTCPEKKNRPVWLQARVRDLKGHSTT